MNATTFKSHACRTLESAILDFGNLPKVKIIRKISWKRTHSLISFNAKSLGKQLLEIIAATSRNFFSIPKSNNDPLITTTYVKPKALLFLIKSTLDHYTSRWISGSVRTTNFVGCVNLYILTDKKQNQAQSDLLGKG